MGHKVLLQCSWAVGPFSSWTVKAETAQKPQCVPQADLHILQLCKQNWAALLDGKLYFMICSAIILPSSHPWSPQHERDAVCTAVVSCWGVHSAGSHSTHWEPQDQGLWGQSFAGTQPHGLRQGWLLLPSGIWYMSCTCCWHPGVLPCLKIFCCIALDSQRTGLSLYLVILIAVVCGAVVFLVISLIMCVRKPKNGE